MGGWVFQGDGSSRGDECSMGMGVPGVSSPLVGSPVEPVIPIRWEDDKHC